MPAGTVRSCDGWPIRYVEEGAGRPIVIVHPGASDASSWAGVAGALSWAFRVVRFDRRLYVGGGPPSSTHTIAHEVQDLLAVVELVGEPPFVVGHSSGAVVALEAALHSPSAIAGLVLYEPPVAATEPLGGEAVVRARAALARGDASAAMAIHLRDVVRLSWFTVALARLQRRPWRSLCAHAAAQIADVAAIDALGVGLDRYSRLEVPTLLLGGARSPLDLRRRLEALARVLPAGHEVVVMPRQGHAAHLTAPKELAMQIHDFADALDASRRRSPRK